MFGLSLGVKSSSASAAAGYDFQNALEFDGVNDYLDGGSFQVVSSSEEFTISIWLNPLINSESGQFWVFENYNVRDYWFFYQTATYLRLNGSGNQNIWDYGYESAGHTGSWTHYVLTRDSSNNIEMYVNGTKQTKSTSNANSNNVQFRYIGRRKSASKHFKGKMDEFIVAKGYCATQQNITDLYNNGLGVDSSTILTSPRHYWLFNETTGTTAADSGSQSNDLTLNNFAGTYWVTH